MAHASGQRGTGEPSPSCISRWPAAARCRPTRTSRRAARRRRRSRTWRITIHSLICPTAFFSGNISSRRSKASIAGSSPCSASILIVSRRSTTRLVIRLATPCCGLVGDRLQASARPTDLVARLGGDEFAIVQTGTEQPSGATALATRLIAEIAKPFELDGHQVVIGASVGISIAPNDGSDPDKLLKNADMALYRAKSDGRDSYRFFEPDMDAEMQARRTMEIDLRRALTSWRVRGLLSAAHHAQDRKDQRLRSASALAPSRARHGTADGVHPGRRRNWADRPNWRLGAKAGLPRSREMAG